jgi:hypothetical protein
LLKDEAFLDELGVRILIPSLEKMTKEFDQARIALRQKINKKKERVVLDKDENIGNVYGVTIRILHQILQRDFAEVKFEDDSFQPEYGRNFLTNCGTCSTTHAEPIPTPITK